MWHTRPKPCFRSLQTKNICGFRRMVRITHAKEHIHVLSSLSIVGWFCLTIPYCGVSTMREQRSRSNRCKKDKSIYVTLWPPSCYFFQPIHNRVSCLVQSIGHDLGCFLPSIGHDLDCFRPSIGHDLGCFLPSIGRDLSWFLAFGLPSCALSFYHVGIAHHHHHVGKVTIQNKVERNMSSVVERGSH